MRNEEWWKGRTIHKAPQYLFVFFLTLIIIMFHGKRSSVKVIILLRSFSNIEDVRLVTWLYRGIKGYGETSNVITF